MTTGGKAGMTEKDDDHDHGKGVASPKTSLQRPPWGINNGTAATGRELSSWRETAPAFEGDLSLIAEMGPMGNRYIGLPYSHTYRTIHCFVLLGRTAPRLYGKQDEQQSERVLCRAAETPFSTGRVFNDTEGLTVSQKTHPDPPIAYFPVLHASINWHNILFGKLVAEFMLDRPEIRIDQRQLKSEAANPVPLKQQGWQQAVEAIYPLKINVLTIHDAKITYIDEDPKKPLNLSSLNLKADNTSFLSSKI
jgi:hypothetical protein